ncbi:MAG: protein kinase [Spirochaetaceae bacterium]|nr:protein kinase [Spirochaetaceae bacterium]
MLESRQVVNQCYILQERLGEDSFCELWRATAIYSATQFLLRFLKPLPGMDEAIPGFRERAMSCYAVAAPSVLDFVEIERWEDRSFISSEYRGHRSLREILATEPTFRLEHACRFMIEIGQGVDAFHKLGIVYRCLNAENVLMLKSGGLVEEIRIQKPGYAAFLPLLPPGDPAADLENYGYMALETKLRGEADRRSDIYSLGIHLFRFLTGKLPYGPVRAKSASAPLYHVSRALARRGVPYEVAMIVVRALRRAPKKRYNDALEFIAELRTFMDARRRELLRAGAVDPIAELETLNLGKQRVDAVQAVRSLDTADYFRAIAEAPVVAPLAEHALLFPVDDFEDAEEVERIEALEAEAPGEDDDDSLPAEAFLEKAAREVAGERASRRRGAAPFVLPRTETGREADASAGAGDGTAEAAAGESGIAGATAEAAAAAERAEKARAAEALPVGEFATDPAPRRRKKTASAAAPGMDAGGVSWRRDAALPSAVVEGLESAFSRSFKGTGAFRFIQEPPPGPDAAAFARVFARFRAKGLVADLGSLAPTNLGGKGADATDFLRALRESLTAGLQAESPASRAVLAKRVKVLDDFGALSAAPLGALLFGADRPEPDPEIAESREGATRIALLVAALARRRRPLVLSLRGGESLGYSAHAILIELARLAPIASFCAFVFYKPAPVPSWHVLSRLAGDPADGQ